MWPTAQFVFQFHTSQQGEGKINNMTTSFWYKYAFEAMDSLLGTIFKLMTQKISTWDMSIIFCKIYQSPKSNFHHDKVTSIIFEKYFSGLT